MLWNAYILVDAYLVCNQSEIVCVYVCACVGETEPPGLLNYFREGNMMEIEIDNSLSFSLSKFLMYLHTNIKSNIFRTQIAYLLLFIKAKTV